MSASDAPINPDSGLEIKQPAPTGRKRRWIVGCSLGCLGLGILAVGGTILFARAVAVLMASIFGVMSPALEYGALRPRTEVPADTQPSMTIVEAYAFAHDEDKTGSESLRRLCIDLLLEVVRDQQISDLEKESIDRLANFLESTPSPDESQLNTFLGQHSALRRLYEEQIRTGEQAY